MRLTAPLLLLALATAGCDNERIGGVVGGGSDQGFNVVLIDDPDALPDGTVIDGFIEADVRVALRNDIGDLVTLGVARDVVFDLQGPGETLRLDGLDRPAAGTYGGVQVSLEGARVELAEGSIIGGTTLAEDAQLQLGTAGAATLEVATLPFDVVSETARTVVIDLNAEQWLTNANIGAATVPVTDLSNNVTVTVQ